MYNIGESILWRIFYVMPTSNEQFYNQGINGTYQECLTFL